MGRWEQKYYLQSNGFSKIINFKWVLKLKGINCSLNEQYKLKGINWDFLEILQTVEVIRGLLWLFYILTFCERINGIFGNWFHDLKVNNLFVFLTGRLNILINLEFWVHI